jgi:hypothetical protein
MCWKIFQVVQVVQTVQVLQVVRIQNLDDMAAFLVLGVLLFEIVPISDCFLRRRLLWCFLGRKHKLDSAERVKSAAPEDLPLVYKVIVNRIATYPGSMKK